MNDTQEAHIRYLTLKSVAIYLDISRSTATRWRREGRLPPSFTVNGFERWRSIDIDAMVERQNAEKDTKKSALSSILDRVDHHG